MSSSDRVRFISINVCSAYYFTVECMPVGLVSYGRITVTRVTNVPSGLVMLLGTSFFLSL